MKQHTLLNLEEQDPEEFMGKVIIWKDRPYYIGRCIGSGNEAIVHKLVEAASGKQEQRNL